MGNILSRIQEIASNEGITIGAMERTIGASKGVLSRAINNGTDIQAKWLSIIVENYPRYSTGWLLTGAGSMLKDDLNGIKTIDEANPSFMPTTSMNPSVGTPYYDVDFIGGFDEVFNSQVNIPATNIVIRGFEKASLWCNVTGHSMEPKINHGDNAHSTTSSMEKSMQWYWTPSVPSKSCAGRRIQASCASFPLIQRTTMSRNSTNHAS